MTDFSIPPSPSVSISAHLAPYIPLGISALQRLLRPRLGCSDGDLAQLIVLRDGIP